MDYILSVCTLGAIYGILAISLNLIVGYTGIFSLNHGALFGVGAFAFGILATEGITSNLLLAIVVAMVAAALLSIAMGLPSLRLQGVYFMVASFAVAIIMYDVFYNYVNGVNQTTALFGYPPPTLAGISFDEPRRYAVLSVVALVLVAAVAWRVVQSPFGAVLRAIRDDESAVRAAGRSVTYYKVSIVAIGGALAGVGGVLYAGNIGVVTPDDYDIAQSIAIFAMVIVGGAGSILGSIVGAALLIAIPQALQYIPSIADKTAYVQQLLYGSLLVVMMLVRRRGLMGSGV